MHKTTLSQAIRDQRQNVKCHTGISDTNSHIDLIPGSSTWQRKLGTRDRELTQDIHSRVAALSTLSRHVFASQPLKYICVYSQNDTPAQATHKRVSLSTSKLLVEVKCRVSPQYIATIEFTSQVMKMNFEVCSKPFKGFILLSLKLENIVSFLLESPKSRAVANGYLCLGMSIDFFGVSCGILEGVGQGPLDRVWQDPHHAAREQTPAPRQGSV